ncbi:MAG: endonuclease [Thermoplasmata archaeon]|nr:endonuclease [Thermoplasmata archaeon]
MEKFQISHQKEVIMLMETWLFFIGLLFGVIITLIAVYRLVISPLREKMERSIEQKRSLSVTYGKITEQFAPFMQSYPFSPENFRFIGSPIDGIQFEDDKIIFVEIKTNKSKLSPLQKKIKELVKRGKVEWFEFDIRS